jgi:thiamine-phosphate pyrophosphorylase
MRASTLLSLLADRLNREAGRPAIPALYFLTDPTRTPDPVRAVRRLPTGTAVIYRHFGAPDRETTAAALAEACRGHDLALLIAADPKLAASVGADGVHWPERQVGQHLPRLGLTTASAHSRRALLRGTAAGADAILLGPVFPSRSPSALRPLGPIRAGALARLSQAPVIALGGVNAHTGKRLLGRGFAGLAAIEGLLAP